MAAKAINNFTQWDKRCSYPPRTAAPTDLRLGFFRRSYFWPTKLDKLSDALSERSRVKKRKHKKTIFSSDWKSSSEFRDLFRGKGESEVGSKVTRGVEIDSCWAVCLESWLSWIIQDQTLCVDSLYIFYLFIFQNTFYIFCSVSPAVSRIMSSILPNIITPWSGKQKSPVVWRAWRSFPVPIEGTPFFWSICPGLAWRRTCRDL